MTATTWSNCFVDIELDQSDDADDHQGYLLIHLHWLIAARFLSLGVQRPVH